MPQGRFKVSEIDPPERAGRGRYGFEQPPASEIQQPLAPSPASPATAPPSPAGPRHPLAQLGQAVLSYLPSARTAAQVSGATIGGTLGSAGGPLGTVGGGALGAGAGESLYQLIQRMRGAADVPQTSSEAAGAIGSAMTGGALQEGVGYALPRIGEALATKLYRTTLKPSTALSSEEATAISKNLLKERIPVSEGGVRKLDVRVKDIGQDVLRDVAAKPGAEISPFAAAQRIEQAVPKFTNQPLPKPDIESLLGTKRELIEQYSTPVPYSPYNPLATEVPPVQTLRMETPLPAMEAQRIKMGGPGHLGKKVYGELKGAEIEGQKQFIRGLKEELEAQFPSIVPKNLRMGNLLEARPELERALNRMQNREAVQIGVPLVTGATQALTGSPGLATLAGLAKNTGSRTAILLDMLAGKSRPLRFGVIPLKRATERQ